MDRFAAPLRSKRRLMPSPFPGMDPFLERPPIFPDLHDSFVDGVKARFQKILPPPYFAAGGSRVWVDISTRSVGPDIGVLKRDCPESGGGGRLGAAAGPN